MRHILTFILLCLTLTARGQSIMPIVTPEPNPIAMSPKQRTALGVAYVVPVAPVVHQLQTPIDPNVTAWYLYQSNDCVHWQNTGLVSPGVVTVNPSSQTFYCVTPGCSYFPPRWKPYVPQP